MHKTVSWSDLLIDPIQRAAGAPGVGSIAYPSGIELVLSSFQIAQGTEITFFPDTPQDCRVHALFFLNGQLEIRLGNGRVGHWIPRTACLLRNDTPGFRLVAQKSGTIAHVGIAMTCRELQKRFPVGVLQRGQDCLLRPGQIDMVRPLLATHTMIDTAMALHRAGMRDAFERSHGEPKALMFLFEALAALQHPAPIDHETILTSQIKTLHDAIANDPSVDLKTALGRSPSHRQQRNILCHFKAKYGTSLRNYRHQKVMENARSALSDGALIKQLAYDLGYSHVANFTRAYRRAFGESPSQTLRRRAANQDQCPI